MAFVGTIQATDDILQISKDKQHPITSTEYLLKNVYFVEGKNGRKITLPAKHASNRKIHQEKRSHGTETHYKTRPAKSNPAAADRA